MRRRIQQIASLPIYPVQDTVRTVVCGPPGAGKTTWVRERRKPGDLVWDFDDVAAVIANCGQPYPRETRGRLDYAITATVNAMRDGFLRYVAACNFTHRSLYVIVADRQQARAIAATINAELVQLEPRPA